LIERCLKRFPNNTDYEVVAMKIGLLDITNSTNISRYKRKISVNNIVEILLNIKYIDERIEQGDISLISEISKISKEKYDLNLFSFASKYCTYHNLFVYGKDSFSIFDSVLMENIPNYTSECSSHKINLWRDSFDYESYWNVITNILKANRIKCEKARRKFDNLVWYYNR